MVGREYQVGLQTGSYSCGLQCSCASGWQVTGKMRSAPSLSSPITTTRVPQAQRVTSLRTCISKVAAPLESLYTCIDSRQVAGPGVALQVEMAPTFSSEVAVGGEYYECCSHLAATQHGKWLKNPEQTM